MEFLPKREKKVVVEDVEQEKPKVEEFKFVTEKQERKK